MKLISLWSGGLDSTISTYYYANKGFTIQPYHILIRNGGGKDAREIESLNNVYNELKNKFPNVLPIIRVKHKLPPSDDRNERLILIIKELVPNFKEEYDGIILGIHVILHNNSSFDIHDDNNVQKLSEKTNTKIYSMGNDGYDTKEKMFKCGLNLLGKEILSLTWSCQLWWKKPCEKCYSCKERIKLFI